MTVAVDKNGNDLKEGTRVLVLATVVGLPNRADGPFVIRLGEGEVPGANVAVHAKHVLLHPNEVAVNGEEVALKRAVEEKPAHKVAVEDGVIMRARPTPSAGWLESQERRRLDVLDRGGPGTSPVGLTR